MFMLRFTVIILITFFYRSEKIAKNLKLKLALARKQ